MTNNEFPKKWARFLPTGFEDNVNSMDDVEMESNIITCEKSINSTEKEMENDSKLNGARDLVKDFSQGYRDVINTQRAKIKFIIYTMESRGKP